MENVIVTIARQYGSGGKTIGEMYAKDQGINCYSSHYNSPVYSHSPRQH